jgi:hypothetical protein
MGRDICSNPPGGGSPHRLWAILLNLLLAQAIPGSPSATPMEMETYSVRKRSIRLGTPAKLSNHGETSDLIRVASAPVNTAQTWRPPTSNSTLKPRRDVSDLIRTSLDPSSCPQASSGKTTTLPTSAMEPTSRTRPTTKDNEYYLHLQHISPPDALWILYKAIEGDLAAAVAVYANGNP